MGRNTYWWCAAALLLWVRAAGAERPAEVAPWEPVLLPALAPPDAACPNPLACPSFDQTHCPVTAYEPPAPAAPDKLTALEQKYEGLAKRVTVFTAGEDWKLVVFGWLQGTMIFSTTRPVAPGTPLLLGPESVFGLPTNTVDAHARASMLGGLLSGPKIDDWQTGGLILVFFYNDNIIADRYGILPFQIWGDLKNDDWRLAAGLQLDIFNPAAPNLLAFSFLFASGNTGNYRGSFRVERYIRPEDDVQITLQAGLGEPISTLVTDTLQVDEDNGWPNVEVRAALGLGPVEREGALPRRPAEVGLSGLIGQVRRTDPANQARRFVADVWGVGLDARWKVCDYFGVQGELFAGQALGTYNGGVLQNFSSQGRPIRAAGGWGEVYFYLWPDKLHTHIGYGIDDPLDSDGPSILRNRTWFANLIWDVTKSLRLGFEATARQTAYPAGLTNNGSTYQTVVQLNF
jgi:hypothetical protein